MSNNTELCTPNPEATIESIRSLGYDLNIAIADLVDNSITAKADKIWIMHKWNGQHSFIAIVDNGIGMDQKKLFKAMSIGSMSPTVERDKNDLGRFGLGLKVASWSQCRKLTVSTKTKTDNVYLRKWDIDFVSKKNEWLLLKETDNESAQLIKTLLNDKSGTVVLWQNLDRLIDFEKKGDKENEQHFYNKVQNLKKYLSMIFHRYISGPKSCKIFLANVDQYKNKIGGIGTRTSAYL